ncbi:MAG: TIGR03618 family F420-dependent PPOX class oxidoreductase [Actinobacteria bacterium]|nr:TIGR03618 family F420-dependent PPOX class oxidoreductase [Actinomycetota bacterium]MSY06629.1 TIGR03618 family F420-dependent PPOX class oxidoreductase [Actinomycetota bacterium]
MSRRGIIRMTEAEVESYLTSGRDLQVASINADGTPHLVTMWFALVDGDLCFWTYGRSQKIVNLQRDPRVTVLVADGDVYEQLRGVSVAGTATVIEDRDEVNAIGEAVFEKYWMPITDEAVREGVHAMGAKRLGVRISLDKVVSWDHSKLEGAY